jgi:hypothetical protein
MVRAFRKTGGTWANQKNYRMEKKNIALNSILGPKYGGKVVNIMI